MLATMPRRWLIDWLTSLADQSTAQATEKQRADGMAREKCIGHTATAHLSPISRRERDDDKVARANVTLSHRPFHPPIAQKNKTKQNPIVVHGSGENAHRECLPKPSARWYRLRARDDERSIYEEKDKAKEESLYDRWCHQQ